MQWSRSKGDKTKIKAAKKEVIAGVILVILLAFAYYIVQVIAANYYGMTVGRHALPRLL